MVHRRSDRRLYSLARSALLRARRPGAQGGANPSREGRADGKGVRYPGRGLHSSSAGELMTRRWEEGNAVSTNETIAEWDERFWGDSKTLCLDCMPVGLAEEMRRQF